MKLEKQTTVIERGGELVERDFGMDLSDAPHIFQILRDTMYSDKPKAVLREYSTNAYDAHIEAGCPNNPILVTLPTAFDLHLKIRDFGPGLSDEGIYNTYVKYGRSTKRDSNDAIGQLGLGSKSAFAYGDSFTITSFHGGTKTIFNAYLDESGVGKVARMHCEPTEEPTGIEITIPVKKTDVGTFHRKAEEVYRYFRILPTIRGVDSFKIQQPTIYYQGNGWACINESTSVAVMGSIGYPLNATAILNLPEDLKNLLDCRLQINFEIGELSISSSRESLQYTEMTCRNIIKKLRIIQGQLKVEVEKKFADCKTEFDALMLYGNLFYRGSNSLGTYITKMFRGQSVTWNGKSISHFNRHAHQLPQGVKLVSFTKDYRGTLKKSEKAQGVDYHGAILWAENDNPTKWVIRSQHLWTQTFTGHEHENDARLYVLTFDTDDAREKFIKEMRLEGVDIKKLSAVDLPPPTATGILAGRKDNIKHKLKCFVLDRTKIDKYMGNERSKCWEPVEIEDGVEQVYVQLDRFYPTLFDQQASAEQIAKLLEHVALAGVDIDKTPVYGFKKDAAIPNNFVKLEDWALNKIKAFLQQHNALQKVLDEDTAKQHGSFDVDKILAVEDQFFLPNSPVLIYCQAVRKMRATKANRETYGKLIEFFNRHRPKDATGDFKPTYDLLAMRADIRLRYPMLGLLGFFDSEATNTKSWIAEIVNYINLIDSQGASSNGT